MDAADVDLKQLYGFGSVSHKPSKTVDLSHLLRISTCLKADNKPLLVFIGIEDDKSGIDRNDGRCDESVLGSGQSNTIVPPSNCCTPLPPTSERPAKCTLCLSVISVAAQPVAPPRETLTPPLQHSLLLLGG